MSTSSPSAPLDFFEEIFCRSYLASGDEIGAIALQLRGPVDENVLRRAVDFLQIRHPRLRSRIAVQPASMEWIVRPPGEAPPIPVEIIEDTSDPLPWESRCHDMFEEGLDFTRGEVGRICLLRNRQTELSELILVSHHHILSGAPGIAAFHELLADYQQLLEAPALPAPAAPPFAHHLRTRLHVPLNSYLAFLPWYVRNLRRLREEVQPLPQAPAPEPDPSLWARQVFTMAETTSLVRCCRSKKTTLLGLLMAASLWALHRVLGRWDVRFHCTAPLDLHHAFTEEGKKVSAHDHGSYVGRYAVNLGVEPGDRLWEVARRFSRRANEESKLGCPAIMHRLLSNPSTRFVGRPWLPKPARVSKRYSGRNKATLNISNTGIAPYRRRYGPLAVESVGIAIRQRIRGANLRINCIVVHNRLNLNLIPWQGVEREFAHAFRGELIALLTAVAADPTHEPRPGDVPATGVSPWSGRSLQPRQPSERAQV